MVTKKEREIERKQKMREGERGERRWCCHGTVTETHDKSMTKGEVGMCNGHNIKTSVTLP